MRVLITGGAGFIGSHLADRLIADGHRVVIIDNGSTGRWENVPLEADAVAGDVADPGAVACAFERHGQIDAVCHIAGHVSLIRSFTDPIQDLETNVEGTVNILAECMRRRVRRLIYASSMTVYGGADAVGPSEDAVCAPISYYGITKYAAERYVHATAARVDLPFDFRVTSFRMYSVYGPRQALDNPYQGVLGIFLGNLLRGEPIQIFGDGEQTRDFVYVGDVVDAWARALQDPATYGQVYNLGSGRQITINALAEHALSALGRAREGNIIHAPPRPGEQRAVKAELRRIHAAMRWDPRTPFEAGLAETVRWAREEVSREAIVRD